MVCAESAPRTRQNKNAEIPGARVPGHFVRTWGERQPSEELSNPMPAGRFDMRGARHQDGATGDWYPPAGTSETKCLGAEERWHKLLGYSQRA